MLNNPSINNRSQCKILAALSAIILAVIADEWCSLSHPAEGLNARPDAVWSYSEKTSWVDTGLKALIFPNGHGFILRSKGPDKPEVWSLVFSPDESKVVYEVCNKNYFFELPSQITTPKTDGANIDIYFAGNNASKQVTTYMSDNISFNRISRVFKDLLEKKIAVTKPVSFDQFVSDCKNSIKKLHYKSPQSACAEQFADDLYVNYYGYGDKAKNVTTILAKLLKEQPAAVIHHHFQTTSGTNSSSQSKIGQFDELTALKTYKQLEKEAKHFIDTKALTGGRENKSKSLLESFSAWWSSEAAWKKGLLPLVVLPPGDKTNPKLNTASRFLFSYSMPWIEQALDYSINDKTAESNLCLKAASTAAEGASSILQGKLPADAQEYYFEDEQGKVIAKKRDNDWRSPSHPFFKCPGYLPPDVYVR